MRPFQKLRLSKGLSQTDLAKKLGVDQSTVSRWEKGDFIPEPQYFPPLAKVFGVTAAEVVDLFAPQTSAPAEASRTT